MLYFVISCNDDGEVSVEPFEKDGLLRYIEEEGYNGESDFIDMDRFTQDPQYWGGRLLIIKGEIVVPKPVTKVTTFEI